MSEKSETFTDSKYDTQEDSKTQDKSLDTEKSQLNAFVKNKSSNHIEPKDTTSPKSSHLDNENSSSNDENKRKRSRRSYNCGPCKKHKIKCDMVTPCGNCVKYNRVHECHKAPPNPPTYQQYLIQQQRRRKYLEKKDRKQAFGDNNNLGFNLAERYTLEGNQRQQTEPIQNINTTPLIQQNKANLQHQNQNFYPTTPLQISTIQVSHVPIQTIPQSSLQPSQIMYPTQEQLNQQQQQQQQQHQQQHHHHHHQQQHQRIQKQNHPPDFHAQHSYPFISQRPIVVPRYHSLDPYILYHPNLPNGSTPINYPNQAVFSQLSPSQPPQHQYTISQHQHQSAIQPGLLIHQSPYHLNPGVAPPVGPTHISQPFIPNDGSFQPVIPPFSQGFNPSVQEQRMPSQPQNYSMEPSPQPSAHSKNLSTQMVEGEAIEKPNSPQENSKSDKMSATVVVPETNIKNT